MCDREGDGGGGEGGLFAPFQNRKQLLKGVFVFQYFQYVFRKFSILQNICYFYLFFTNNMYKLLAVLFVIEWYARNSVFKPID